ncbi:DUF6440 family protein [Metabacillus sp. 84]|uniref:DUF6440 family protein n=1 Tax=unclassified Metabacillus TaxID=2675274 RepID=UPI003CECA95F
MFRSKKEKRFEERHVQNSQQGLIYIWVDRETGVNYLYTWNSQGCALTPLLDENGNVIVEPVEEK